MKRSRTWGTTTSGIGIYKTMSILTSDILSARPKFSVVVVKKRIITRIFTSHQGRMDNPPPGTIVDSVITKPEW